MINLPTKVKLCGLYRPEDVAAVNEIEPDYAGFITYKKSHRYVTKEQMAELTEQLSPAIEAVGVFVNEPLEEVASYVNEGIIDIVQLHGQEDDDYIDALRKIIPDGTEIWKAFLIGSKEDLDRASTSTADLILLDNVAFGSGKPFDWNLLETGLKRPYVFAGGLNPDNVEEAIERFHPYAVDLSSGVETEQKKDPAKMQLVVDLVRGDTAL